MMDNHRISIMEMDIFMMGIYRISNMEIEISFAYI